MLSWQESKRSGGAAECAVQLLGALEKGQKRVRCGNDAVVSHDALAPHMQVLLAAAEREERGGRTGSAHGQH